MGSLSGGRGLGLFVFLFFCGFTNTAQAEKYMVAMSSSEAFEHARAGHQRSGLFLGARVTSEFLNHVEIAIIEADSAMAAEIRSQRHVAFVEEERWFAAPRPVPRARASAHVPLINQDITWGVQTVNAEEAWKKTRGAGVRVMVLDSGVDEKHPDLSRRFEKGRFFTSNSLTDSIGHGTHVAGTIVSDGSHSGLLGVAPEARFLAGKVCNGGCSTTAIVQGIDWAISEKVDVINMSLGGPFSSAAQAQACDRAEKAGITVVAATGNNGKGAVSYPAAISTVVAVGALNADLTKASFSQWGPEVDVMAPGVNVYSTVPQGTGRQQYARIEGREVQTSLFSNVDYKLTVRSGNFEYIGLGKAADVAGKNLAGKITLIARGEIPFAEKVKNALSVGASAIVVFNHEDGLTYGGLDTKTDVPVLMIEKIEGEEIVRRLGRGDVVSGEIGTAVTDYASQQGTSMATPHVTGVVALMRAVNKKMTPVQVRETLKTTATPLTPNPNNEFGRGLVDAAKAVDVSQAL